MSLEGSGVGVTKSDVGGREFQTVGAATENACSAMSVRVRGTISSGAAADRS